MFSAGETKAREQLRALVKVLQVVNAGLVPYILSMDSCCCRFCCYYFQEGPPVCSANALSAHALLQPMTNNFRRPNTLEKVEKTQTLKCVDVDTG